MSNDITFYPSPTATPGFSWGTRGDIKNLAAAVSAAQAEMKGTPKGSENPYFTHNGKAHRYTELGTLWDAHRDILARHGLAIFQPVSTTPDGKGVTVTTLLVHAPSGEFISSPFTVFPRPERERDKKTRAIIPDSEPFITAQGMGSATTYARRYSLSSLIGAVSEADDDGNKASGTTAKDDFLEGPQAPSVKPTAKSAKPVQKAQAAPQMPKEEPPAQEATQTTGGNGEARQAVLDEIAEILRALVPGEGTKVNRERKEYIASVFGRDKWTEVQTLPLSALAMGRDKLGEEHTRLRAAALTAKETPGNGSQGTVDPELGF